MTLEGLAVRWSQLRTLDRLLEDVGYISCKMHIYRRTASHQHGRSYLSTETGELYDPTTEGIISQRIMSKLINYM